MKCYIGPGGLQQSLLHVHHHAFCSHPSGLDLSVETAVVIIYMVRQSANFCSYLCVIKYFLKSCPVFLAVDGVRSQTSTHRSCYVLRMIRSTALTSRKSTLLFSAWFVTNCVMQKVALFLASTASCL